MRCSHLILVNILIIWGCIRQIEGGFPETVGHSRTTQVQVSQAYFDVLLLHVIERHNASLHKQNTNPRKIYAIDNGLINAMVAGRNKNEGRFLENLLLLELRRRYADLYYY